MMQFIKDLLTTAATIVGVIAYIGLSCLMAAMPIVIAIGVVKWLGVI